MLVYRKNVAEIGMIILLINKRAPLPGANILKKKHIGYFDEATEKSQFFQL